MAGGGVRGFHRKHGTTVEGDRVGGNRGDRGVNKMG